MPIYEYTCLSCKREFEQLLRSTLSAGEARCPTCKGSDVVRKLSVFAARQGSSKPSGAPPQGPCSQCCNPDGPCLL